MKFTLPPAFMIHHEQFDADHKRLCVTLNKAWNAFEEDKLYDYQPHINRFITQLKRHFVAEEQEMRKNKYPELASHKDHHAHILNEVTRLKEQCDELGYLTKDILLQQYANLVEDVVRADLDYGTYLTTQQSRTSKTRTKEITLRFRYYPDCPGGESYQHPQS